MSDRHLFAHPFPVEGLKREGVDFDRVADAAERARIARRLDLVALTMLAAKGRVQCDEAGLIVVEGALEAAVTQRCVVTLDPFESETTLPFKRVFTIEAVLADETIVLDDTSDDAPEPLDGPFLDVGEVVVEELSLGLDPYPHGPDAEAALKRLGVRREGDGPTMDDATADDDDGTTERPFAALGRLRRRPDGA